MGRRKERESEGALPVEVTQKGRYLSIFPARLQSSELGRVSSGSPKKTHRPQWL